MLIRSETAGDREPIQSVVAAAFGGPNEALLIDLIRAAEGFGPDLSLVAEIDGVVAGHVLFSPVVVQGGERFEVLSLAPLAVHPDHQGQGIGVRLMAEAIDFFKGEGARVITLNTQQDNQVSQRLYRWFGFRLAGEKALVLRRDLAGARHF